MTEKTIDELLAIRAQLDDLIGQMVDLLVKRRSPLVEAAAPRVEETAGVDDYITLSQVCAMLSLSKATVYRMIQAGRFPAGKAFGARSPRWRRGDVLELAKTL